jgi:hypothetical protein
MFSGGETDRHATARELSPKKGEDLSFAETKIKKVIGIFFFCEKHSTNTDTHTRTSTHSYEHMYAHPTPMSTSERLSRLDLRFTKSVIKSVSLSMETSPLTEIIISQKCNTHIKYRI